MNPSKKTEKLWREIFKYPLKIKIKYFQYFPITTYFNN